ncbi:MAG: NAD(P)-binding domain-containing protein, partial [Eubacteriales bacterium]|nr:NAD(P)-binding domain-containing protein [Eubacteriales bacterium]
ASLQFYVSPRNRQKAAALAKEFPQQVTVCVDNQQVVDHAEWVILALLPPDAEQILKPLAFRPEQKILSLISDHRMEDIVRWTGCVSKAIRMVPLPFAERHIGPIAYYPADEEIDTLFRPLGQLVALEHEDTLHAVLALTALMSPFYLLIHKTAEWGKEHGLSDPAAVYYLSSFFAALSTMAQHASDSKAVEMLCRDTTKGGLNESAYRWIDSHGGYDFWLQALDRVWDRCKQA